MSEDRAKDAAQPEREVLHGGASRLATRTIVPDVALPQQVSWYEVEPGGCCTPHVHTGKAETWLVVEGEGRAIVGEAEYEVTEGDLLVAEPGTRHALHNTGMSPLRFVNIVAMRGPEPVTTRELDGP